MNARKFQVPDTQTASSTTDIGRMFPVANQEFTAHEIDDDLVLYNPRTDDVLLLNQTAGAIWWMCDGRRNGMEIAEAFGQLFAKSRADALADVRETLGHLLELEAVWGRLSRATAEGI